MARYSYAKAVAALQSGDRIMVTNPDPNRADDRRRYCLLASGGGADRHHLRQAAARSGAFRGWTVPGRAFANIHVEG